METAIQNMVLRLGYEELGNAKIQDVLEAGMDKLDELLELGVVKRKLNSKGYFVIEIEDYEKALPEYVVQTLPVKLDNNSTKHYFRFKSVEGKAKSVKSYIVKPTYVFTQCSQPNSILKLLGKQNAIKWRTNKWILEFDRENKSENYTQEFMDETNLMHQAIENIDEFYVGHRFDKRGRFYPDTYVVNYQGDEWCKAAISPCIVPEKLTKEGVRQLKIDIASYSGLDKMPYDFRVKAFDEADDITHLNNGKLKKPLLVHKGVLAWNEALANDGMSDYCCGVDATASGMQILAILANCELTAKYTNLTDTSTCYDVYGEACRKILEYTKAKGVEVSDIRDIVKKALMTRGYNSRKQVEEALVELVRKHRIVLTLNKLIEILDISPKIKEVKNAMNECLIDTFKDLPDEEQIVQYTMPDGFIVQFANIRKKKVRCNRRLYNFTYKYDELGWNKELNWRALAPNLVHSK